MDNTIYESFYQLLAQFEILDQFWEDIEYLFNKRRGDKKLITAFETRLRQLADKRERAILLGRSAFELLKKSEGIYSMPVDTNEVNYRVLYSFEKGGTILIHGFFERGGKRKTNYSTAIPAAQKRLKSWRENHE